MFSTDQTHLCRYFATLGVAIAAGTLSLAGLFLKLQQDLLVTQATLAKITPTARDALLRRQEYLSVGTIVLPWFVLVGFFGGVGLSIYGMIGWANRQKIIDEREDIGLRKDRFEFSQLTESEKADKLNRDAKEAAKVSSSGLPRPGAASVASVRSVIAIVNDALVSKLREVYGSGRVRSPVVLGGEGAPGQRFEVDALVLARSNSASIIFELKYASSAINVKKQIMSGLRQLERATSVFGGKGALVVVVPDDATDLQIEQWYDQAREWSAMDSQVAGIYIGRYSHFLALSGARFAAELGLKEPEN